VTLARLCHGGVKSSEDTIAKSLEGDYRPEHLFALRQSRFRPPVSNDQKQVVTPMPVKRHKAAIIRCQATNQSGDPYVAANAKFAEFLTTVL
jgi:hypothetical protein